VTGRTHLLHGDEESIAIAVTFNTTNELNVSTGIPFSPQFSSRSGVVNRSTGCERGLEGITIHVGKHQHATRGLILSNDRNEPLFVEHKALWDGHAARTS
jgi:hypothetical protein